ncbi:MAG TPA: hypothetical protein VM284_00515 [Candidatus Limnocylindria bacterium]|nr:hypothetical protein [Candidatus Limnocylindria bacterium]
MTDEQQPPPPMEAPPPPPGSGPFAFPPPPEQQPYGVPRGFYPLDLDAIARNTASIFRFAWPTLLGVALVPNVIVYALMVPLAAIASPGFNRWLVQYQESVPLREIPPFPEELKVPLVLLVLAGFASALVGLIVSAAVVQIGDSVFRGRPVSVREALGFAIRRAPAVIGGQLLLFLAAFGIVLLGIVFGAFMIAGGSAAAFLGLVLIVASFAALMFLAIRWSLLVQTVVIERVGAVDGLSRSWRLVAGSGWRVLGYLFLLGLVAGVVAAIFSAVPEAVLKLDGSNASGAAIGTMFDGIAAILLAPIAPLVMLFLYYDLRFKKGEPAPQPGEARQQEQEQAGPDPARL